LRIDLHRGMNRIGHLRFVIDQKTGFSVIDNLRESTGAKRDHRRPASKGFHRDQRTCFGNQAGHEQASRAGEEAPLPREAKRTKKPMSASETRRDLAFEIIEKSGHQ